MPHPSVTRAWQRERAERIAAGYGCVICNTAPKGIGGRAISVCEHGVSMSPEQHARQGVDQLQAWLDGQAGGVA